MFASLPIKTRFSHIFYIFLVYLIIFIVTFNINYYIVFDFDFPIFLRIFSLIIFNFFSFMTIITHLKSMFTNPGFVPFNFSYTNFNNNNNITEENFSILSQQYNLYCSKCKNFRPFRSHHCKICNRCVLKMDHHCFWIYNCVGFYNQKNFYQFLFYATFGDLIAFLIFVYISIEFVDFDIEKNINGSINNVFELIYQMGRPINIVIAILSSFSMVVGIGFLWIKHTRMLMNNQTTIEKKMFKNWKKSLFYVEDQLLCFKSVMGKNVWDFFSLKFSDCFGTLMKNHIEIVKKNKRDEIEIISIDLLKNNKKTVVNKNNYEKLDESY